MSQQPTAPPSQGLYPQVPQQDYPPQGYTAPPQGYTAPPQGYTQPPPQGYTAPPQGYTQPPPQGYTQPPPQGYTQPPPQGYTQPPPQGYTAPPQGYTAPPQGYTAQPPQGYTAQPPPQGYNVPPQGYAYVAPTPAQTAPAPQRVDNSISGQLNSVLKSVEKMTFGGVAQPRTSIECLKNGNTISLKSRTSQYLRILADGRVDCRAADDKNTSAQFVIGQKRPNVVTLQSAGNPNFFLAIHQGLVIGTGQGGPFCEFQLVEAPEKQISFQSIAEAPLCIGVASDGAIADPRAVQPGHHFAQFNATLLRDGVGTTKGLTSGPSSGMPVSYALRDKNIVQLISRCSGKPIHIAKNGLVTASGGYDELSELKVIEKAPGVVVLQSASMFSFHIAIHNDEFIGRGQGGDFCQLKVSQNQDNYALFESVKCPGSFLGANQHGATDRPSKTCSNSMNAQFRIRIVRLAQSDMPLPILLRFDGQPSALNQLKDGTAVHLVSRAFGNSLQIQDSGIVACNGNMDRKNALVVRNRGGNVLSFQHSQHAGFMIGIVNNTLRGKGAQGPQLDFTIHETYDGHILLESITSPGNFVAVDSQGKIKPPNNTSIQDPDCQFYVQQA